MKLTNMGRPIHPRFKSLLTIIFMVTHFFYYLKKMYPNKIIDCTFLLLPQEDGHKFWVRIVTISDVHVIKVTHDPDHILFINLINDRYEKVMLCNNISNCILQKRDNDIVW